MTAQFPTSPPLFWKVSHHENLGPQPSSHARPERKEVIDTKWPLAACQPHQLPYSPSTGSPSECFCLAERAPATPLLLPKGEIPAPARTPVPPFTLARKEESGNMATKQSTQTSHIRLID